MSHAQRLDSSASSSDDDGGIAFCSPPHSFWLSSAPAHCRASAAPAVYRFGQLLSHFCHCAGHGVLHRASYSAVPLCHHVRTSHPSPGVWDLYPVIARLRLAVLTWERQ